MGSSAGDMTSQLANQMSGAIDPNTGLYDPNLERIRQLGASSANPEKVQALKSQRALAEYLRAGPDMPHGQYIPGYHGIGHYVAASPLQTIASALGYGVGAKQSADALAKEQGMAGDEANNRAAVMSMIYEQAKRQQNDQDQYSSLMSAVGHPDLSGMAATPNIDDMPVAQPRNTNMVTPPAARAAAPNPAQSWDDYLRLQQAQAQ